MARKLKKLTNKIHTYIYARLPKQKLNRLPIHVVAGEITLQPALQTSFLQGEAILRLTFFQCLAEKHIVDPVDQAHTWQQLISDQRFIQQVVEHSELIQFFSFNTSPDDFKSRSGEIYQELCFHTFCILLWDIHNNDPSFARQLVGDIINHFLPTLYPKKAKPKDASNLKSNLAKQLAKIWHTRPEIKESFKVSEDKVVFSLLGKIPHCAPVNLLTIEGVRLKPTRLTAYQQAIEGIESGELAIAPIKSNSVKKQSNSEPFS